MATVIIIIAIVFIGCTVVNVILISKAPMGHEDEDGFHLDEPK